VLIYALKEGLDKILEEGLSSVFQRHKAARLAARRAVEALGPKPYPQTLECTCPTVTAFKTPYRLPSLGDISGRSTECCWPVAGGLWRAR